MRWVRRHRVSVSTLIIALLLGGCMEAPWRKWRAQELPITENPFPGVRHVVVTEFRDWSGYGLDGWKVADFFASELSQAGFYDVLPVMQVKATSAAANLDSKDPESALAIARSMEADAVILGGITTYEPYIPKRVGLSAVMLTAGADLSEEGVRAIMELEQTGRAMDAFSPSGPAGLLAYQARIFDASHNELVEEAKAYAAQRKGRQGPLGWRAYLEITEEFLRFACNRLVRQMLTEQLLIEGATKDSGA